MALRLLCGLLVIAGLGFAQNKAPSADDVIYDKVRYDLAMDRDVRGAAIDVVVTDGAVVLKGNVRDQKAREKATKIVRKVKGVKSVDNQLKLFNEK